MMCSTQARRRLTRAQPNGTPSFGFKEIAAGSDENHYVAEGYDAEILIRWGDPVLPGAPPFDPQKQTPEAQAKQFGYNNDYVGYIPLDGSRRGLLVVNHEYTNEELMFPQLPGRQDLRDTAFKDMTKELVEIEMMAHGGSVLEVVRGGQSSQQQRAARLDRPRRRSCWHRMGDGRGEGAALSSKRFAS